MEHPDTTVAAPEPGVALRARFSSSFQIRRQRRLPVINKPTWCPPTMVDTKRFYPDGGQQGQAHQPLTFDVDLYELVRLAVLG